MHPRRNRHSHSSWQMPFTRWLLVLAILAGLAPVTLGPLGSTPARAQALARTGQPLRQAVIDDDDPSSDRPEHEPLDDGSPGARHRGVLPSDDDIQDGVRVATPRKPPRQHAPCTIPDGQASFGADDRLVMTYYYYWYDQQSLEDPALSQRPPADPPIDWRDVAWHERQLSDMASAGIDVALAVYWGDGSDWSVEGLDAMVEAREHLLAAGMRPPAIGLFFDTNLYATILPERPELADLTTDDGLEMLADQVSAYLDRVPACHRARVDGRPLAFFWRADTEDGDRFRFDERTFGGLEDLITARYNERLHFVLEHSWETSAREANVELGAVDTYRWGAALNGPRFEGRTVAVGPGYDDRRIDGRPGYLRDRDEGGTFSRDLRRAVLSGTPWLLLETWNELWEGTAIAETEENGRTYLDITTRYAILFHKLTDETARDGWFDLGSGQGAYLRRLADAATEQGTPSLQAGRHGAQPLREDEDGTGYFHFAIDARLRIEEGRPLTVLVEYFDGGEGSFVLEYDSLDPDAPEEGVYKLTEPVELTDTGAWRTAHFELPDVSLLHRQYDGVGSFRLHDLPGPDGELHTFGRVTLTAVPGFRPVALEPESLDVVWDAAGGAVTLRWTDVGPDDWYIVQVQPFDDDLSGPRGYDSLDRRRCQGEALLGAGGNVRGLANGTSCRLMLGTGLGQGLYRWRVQAIDREGFTVGAPSDWAYFLIASK